MALLLFAVNAALAMSVVDPRVKQLPAAAHGRAMGSARRASSGA